MHRKYTSVLIGRHSFSCMSISFFQHTDTPLHTYTRSSHVHRRTYPYIFRSDCRSLFPIMHTRKMSSPVHVPGIVLSSSHRHGYQIRQNLTFVIISNGERTKEKLNHRYKYLAYYSLITTHTEILNTK